MTNAPIKFTAERARLIEAGLIIPGNGGAFPDDDDNIPPGVKLNASQLERRGFTLAADAKRRYEYELAERRGY